MNHTLKSTVAFFLAFVIFGLNVFWVSATPTVSTIVYDEYGELSHNSSNLYVDIGQYHNTFASTSDPFTAYFYVQTVPYYYEQALYSSQLKATSVYETYYYVYSASLERPIEVTITDDVFDEGTNGSSALVEGWDYDTAYLQLSQAGYGTFYYRMMNTVSSTVTTEFFSEYVVDRVFRFDGNGIMMTN